METLARRLAAIDELETWKLHCHGYSVQDKQSAFERAQPLWVKRKVSEGTLYLHPDVIAELRGQDWVPNDLQKRMIWASVLASAEGTTSRERFKTIKTCILKSMVVIGGKMFTAVKSTHLRPKSVSVSNLHPMGLLLICS